MAVRPSAGWVNQVCRYISRRPFSARLSLRNNAANGSLPLEPALSPLPPTVSASGLARLSNRRVIALHGQDTEKFLQGLVSQDMRAISTHGVYSAILSAPGRVLFDIFIYPAHNSDYYKSSISRNLSPDDPAYIVEYDSSLHKYVYKYLKRYKLRAKVDIRILDEDAWGVWSAWQPPSASGSAFPLWTKYNAITNLVGCTDPRAPGMGQRFVLPTKLDTRAYLQQHLPPSTPPPPSDTTLMAYTIHRMLHGVPEGPAELIHEIALPLESNFDLSSAISLNKGCYVGQELTVRTAHTGVVRKRILPVILYDSAAGDHAPTSLHYDPSSLAQSLNALSIPHESSIIPSDPSNSSELRDSKLERQRSRDLSANRNPRTGQLSRSSRASRAAGKWLNGVGNIGLALCRVDVMTDLPVSKTEAPVVEQGAGGEGAANDTTAEADGSERQFKIVWEDCAGLEPRQSKAESSPTKGVKRAVGVKALVPDWMRANWKVKAQRRRV